uniref:Venom protein n=1 Tax=Steinernema glaseri TaxID=37863 RepID=A0A1I7Y7G0_9BILA
MLIAKLFVLLMVLTASDSKKTHFSTFQIMESLCTIRGESSPCFREQYSSLSNYETEEMVVSAAEQYCDLRTKRCQIDKLFQICCENPYNTRLLTVGCRNKQ